MSFRLQRVVSGPIVRLAETAQRISSARDYSLRVHKEADDELGTLYDEFNAMLDQIEHGERELRAAHDELELRVEKRTRQLSEANHELSKEVAERRRAEQSLEEVHRQLVDAARKAGMAEIATDVLHNVGNVLNSINVSMSLLVNRVRGWRIADAVRALDMLDQHQGDLGGFLTEHQQGKQIPRFLRLVCAGLKEEQVTMTEELGELAKNVNHVKTIVAMQQSYAGVGGVTETVSPAEMLDDALRINSTSLMKHAINVVRDYADLPRVQTDKSKLLQILVNLVTNAKDAMGEGTEKQRCLTVRIRKGCDDGEENVLFEVADNGVGISEDNLTRIFAHGFTTKKHGHGFGLHSSANAAKELGGTLVAQSDGPGRGATFVLGLPCQSSIINA